VLDESTIQHIAAAETLLAELRPKARDQMRCRVPGVAGGGAGVYVCVCACVSECVYVSVCGHGLCLIVTLCFCILPLYPTPHHTPPHHSTPHHTTPQQRMTTTHDTIPVHNLHLTSSSLFFFFFAELLYRLNSILLT
jgi:hypothetical protein